MITSIHFIKKRQEREERIPNYFFINSTIYLFSMKKKHNYQSRATFAQIFKNIGTLKFFLLIFFFQQNIKLRTLL